MTTIQAGEFWIAEIPFTRDCLEKSLLVTKIGMISETDAQQLKIAWEMYVKPQF